MNTKPLYLENAYLKTCTAKIINLVVNKDHCVVILDQTIFYPEGGGQPCDHGIIKTKSGKLKVEKVFLKEDKILHEGKLTGKLRADDKVECDIDWTKRFHNMQIHSAGHIVHEATKILIPDLIPIEGQHGKHPFIKYQGTISQTLERPILEQANQIIAQDLEIQTEFVSLDELKKRSPWIPPHLPTNKPLRIMWIGNYPPIPDGGTQVKRTGEIPLISQIHIETDNDITTVRYSIKLDRESVSTNTVTYTNFDKNKLQNLKNEALAQIIQATDPLELENLRNHYLSKKGALAEIAKELPNLSPEEKSEAGKIFNDVKFAITEALGSKPNTEHQTLDIDLTLPGTPIAVGLPHPISAVAKEMNDIFQSLGFSVADGPEIETDEYNYNRLNLPPDHPARDLQDSLYLREPDVLLRTHTSSVEAHILADHKPPYRFVFPGKSYRYENVNASNHMMFYQYQGVAVGEGITLANLKWTLDTFVKKFFGPERVTRFRCKYYPEVEPGVGVDINCEFCKGHDCAVCKNRGWIEMLGAGMIHPNLLKKVDLDPQKYSGFAWGMGLDRIVMTRYKINDIRAFYNGDLVYNI